jgi:phage FluMu gp28-like protein
MHLINHELDSDKLLVQHFMPHQIAWINAELPLHNQGKQVIALAEKSVRIGWTYADGFKNVRKRLWFKNRDYLFATKDYPSALEYVRQCYKFAEIFNLTRSIISHGEESIPLNRLDEHGRPSSFTEDVKIGLIKFDNGSRILAFSANPQAMSVYGGDVGLDEFAKHPNARLLWETAQARVTWNYDLALWSSHDGEDTLFNEFAREARASCSASQQQTSTRVEIKTSDDPNNLTQDIEPPTAVPVSHPIGEGSAVKSPVQQSKNPPIHFVQSPPPGESIPQSELPIPHSRKSPWNVYFRVTLVDAIKNGLLETINAAQGASITRAQFLADCRARAREEEIFEQSYMCNPLGAAANHIVGWSAIERCRHDYQIERVHLEADHVALHFGEYNAADEPPRTKKIHQFLNEKFEDLHRRARDREHVRFRLGFDVAASGKGDLAVIYIDEAIGDELRLRALLTSRTDDWHFHKATLFYFLKNLPWLHAAGDESGLGLQLCWEAASKFPWAFKGVNLATKKHDLGFALMNQLSMGEKLFPKSEQDIAADFFALRKSHNGTRWTFSEGPNAFNAASHCDIAWAGALSSFANTKKQVIVGAIVA